jgi:hypothetical protein
MRSWFHALRFQAVTIQRLKPIHGIAPRLQWFNGASEWHEVV